MVIVRGLTRSVTAVMPVQIVISRVCLAIALARLAALPIAAALPGLVRESAPRG
jgi:hypothetical protein